MGIDLALENLIFQIFFLFFVVDPFFHQINHVKGKPVDTLSDIAQLMLPFDRRIPGEIAVGNFIDFFLDPGYRLVDGTA